MKKLLSSLMAATVVASSAATVVACGSDNEGSEIYLITDAGKITDKSFNESGYNGGNAFLANILQPTEKDEEGNEVAIKDPKISYIEPASLSRLGKAYNQAAKNGAKTLILPGFHHAIEGNNEAASVMKDVNGSTILLDGSSNEGTTAAIDNQIGIMFRGDISGFQAGVAAIVYGLSNSELVSDNVLSLATYGGVHNNVAVDAYMVGFLAAIEVYEKGGLDSLIDGGEATRNTVTVKFTQDNLPKNSEDGAWFSNSFDAGGGRAISDTLLDKGADIIMPVAGPQTLDTLESIKNKNKTTKIVGVDTDQVLSYGAFDDKFVTSAQKDLLNATTVALAHTKTYNDNKKVQENIASLEGEIQFTWANVAEGESNSVDIKDFSESWEGRDLYVGGSIATSEKNLIAKSNKFESVNTYIGANQEKMLTASLALFEKMNGFTSEKDMILTDAIISAYADAIVAAK